MGRKQNTDREGPPIKRSGPSLAWTELAMLAGVAVAIVVGTMNYRATVKLEASTVDRLGKMETRLTQMSSKMEMLARPAPAQRGPDPNKVYAVKIDGAPFEGPKEAPVTIAEFSDFQ